MPSVMKIAGVVATIAAVASALPQQFTPQQNKIMSLAKRQQSAAEQALGLTDVDILQFALTLEWLEATFYQQGFAMFPPEQFAALGLDQLQIQDLQGIGQIEATHVQTLQGAIAQTGVQPVQQCQYNFGFTDAAGMIATAGVLENIGVSAYLAAAPILASPAILGTAGSILTVEARHQTFVRTASNQVAVPQPFDTPLSPKAVFSLAAPFLGPCPDGSNLALTAFPPLTMAAPSPAPTPLAAGTTLQLQSTAAAGAQFCGFINGNVPGGTAFMPFTEAGGCMTPQNLAGIAYVTLTNAAPVDGMITDDIIVAGPMVLTVT